MSEDQKNPKGEPPRMIPLNYANPYVRDEKLNFRNANFGTQIAAGIVTSIISPLVILFLYNCAVTNLLIDGRIGIGFGVILVIAWMGWVIYRIGWKAYIPTIMICWSCAILVPIAFLTIMCGGLRK